MRENVLHYQFLSSPFSHTVHLFIYFNYFAVKVLEGCGYGIIQPLIISDVYSIGLDGMLMFMKLEGRYIQ